MRSVDKFFAAIGIIGTAGAIVAGFFGQRMASLVMLALLLLVWQIWLTVEIVILRRTIVVTAQKSATRPRHSYLEQGLLISSAKMNPFKISAEFLLWPECTVMFWVLVPPKGEGLRDSPSNRYLLAHHTGKVKTEDKDAFRNQFALRHSSANNRWEFLTSNGAGEYGGRLTARDGLEPGWHHFLISWDRTRPKIVLQIDGGAGGSDVSNASFEHWPSQTEKLFLGTWPSEWRGHFCETKLLHVRLFDRFLTVNDPEVQDELRVKPRA